MGQPRKYKSSVNAWWAVTIGQRNGWFGICSQIWRVMGQPKKIQKSRMKVCASWRFDSWLEICAGSIYHVHFAWQVWHGQLSPRFKINKLKSFSGVEIDQNHVDKRILGGKGLQYKSKKHNFCPASALRHRCCIDTEVFMWIHSA